MNWATLCAGAGSVATMLFVVATLPMLIKAGRSRDLRSYSGANLVISNCGNLLQSLYVTSLPFGPIWGLHLFNTIASLLMLTWWLRHRQARRESKLAKRRPPSVFSESAQGPTKAPSRRQ